MLKAVCAVCKETVRVTAHKLITVQWVDAQSGGLCALHFHSDCYFRWYQQTAAEAQRRLGTPQSAPRSHPAALPAPREGAPPPAGESLLTEEEKRALLRLRRRARLRHEALDAEPEAGPESAASAEEAPGAEETDASAPEPQPGSNEDRDQGEQRRK